MVGVETLTPKRIQEAITSFASILRPQDVAQAQGTWDPIVTTHDGQKRLIDEARAGNLSAINYIYLRLIPQISSAFWEFIGSDPKFRRMRIERGDQFLFISTAYQMLLASHLQNLPPEEALDTLRQNWINAGRAAPSEDELQEEYDDIMSIATPLDTFDYSFYDENTDLVNKLGFQVQGTLRNESKKINRLLNLGGIVVPKVSKKEKEDKSIANVSYEAHFENDEDATTGDPDFLKPVIVSEAWEAFSKDGELDKGKFPNPRIILKTFLSQGEEFSVNKAKEDLGVTDVTVRTKLGTLGPLMDKHGISRDMFRQLMKDPGPEALIASL